MSERRIVVVDIRPVATHGWTVAVANAVDESGEIERETFALAGWAICRDVVNGELAGPPVVVPCWHSSGDLITDMDVDASEVVPLGAEPDWRELKSLALAQMVGRHHAKVARDGR